jgi:hypothetical protein
MESSLLMIARASRFSLVLAFCVTPPMVTAARAGAHHPRLFLSTRKVAQLRSAVRTARSHHAEAFGALKRWVDRTGRRPYDPAAGNWNYGRAYMARGAAFLAVVTGQKAYSDLAFAVLKDVHDDPDPDRRLPDRLATYGLARATVGEGFALAYDWCYNDWTPSQRDYVKSVIRRSLDVWPQYSHSQLQVPRGSNWAAVCRGAELVMLLATYEDRERPERLAYLKNQLARHMAIAYGPGGLSQEGIGYTGYGGTFLLEACYALADTGDDTLVEGLSRHAFWKLQMFAASSVVTDGFERRYLQQGVSGTAISDEGWVSQTIRSVPPESLPHFGWFYERHMGRLAPGAPGQKYDDDRAAWIWALIHYPPGLETRDPAGVMPPFHFDAETGGYFFRNRWRNANDILCAVYADLANHKAWDTREATGIRLIAHGTAFFGGPGKRQDATRHSRLLIDGRADAGKGSGRNGRPVLAEGRGRGGYVVVGGGSTYRDLGVEDLRRHVFVDFHPRKNAAIVSTLDRIRSGDRHTYTWNANLGDEKGDDGIVSAAGTEAGHPTFLLRGASGWVKGWVLCPNDATVLAGDPLQIRAGGRDADIWVVMRVGVGRVPIGRVSGHGLSAELQLDDVRVRYNARADRITADHRR